MSLAAAILLVPMSTAAVTALCRRRPTLQRGIHIAGTVIFLCLALRMLVHVAGSGSPLETGFGGWPMHVAVAFHIDGLSAVLIAVTALAGALTIAYFEGTAAARAAAAQVRPLMQGLIGGAAAAFATADLFNLYVWFEWILVCSLGLLASIGGRRSIEATFKYLVLNLFATVLLLGGIGLMYGLTGQLSFSGLQTTTIASPALRDAVLGLIVIALLAKSAAFPLYSWLPAAYPVLPIPVLALCGGLLSKVGIYAILRLLGDVFAGSSDRLAEPLGWIACATMITGVFGAVYHYDVRRLLSFHAISQNGYLLLGIALGTRAGMAATLFYTAHYVLVKINLFLIAGLMHAECGSHDLRRQGGLLRSRPVLAVLFGLSALSLVGIPPFSGFWAKLLIVGESLDVGRGSWAALALVASLLTLYSMAKIWLEAFWKPAADNSAGRTEPPGQLRLERVCVWMLTLVTLWIGVAPGRVLEWTRVASLTLGQGGTP